MAEIWGFQENPGWLVISNPPGTAGGPDGRDRTLSVKNRKIGQKIIFFSRKKKITQKLCQNIGGNNSGITHITERVKRIFYAYLS